MCERGLGVAEFGQRGEHLSVESGLLPRQHVDVSVLEVVQQFALDPEFELREAAVANVDVVIGELLLLYARTEIVLIGQVRANPFAT